MDPSDPVLSLIVTPGRGDGIDLSTASVERNRQEASLSHTTLDHLSTVAEHAMRASREKACLYCLSRPDMKDETLHKTQELLTSMQLLLHAAGQYARFCRSDLAILKRDDSSDPVLQAVVSLEEESTLPELASLQRRCREAFERAKERYSEARDAFHDLPLDPSDSLLRMQTDTGEHISYNQRVCEFIVEQPPTAAAPRQQDPLRRMFQREAYEQCVCVIQSELPEAELSSVLGILYPETRIFRQQDSPGGWLRVGSEVKRVSEFAATPEYTEEQNQIDVIERSLDNVYGTLIDSQICNLGIGFLGDAPVVDVSIRERRKLHDLAEEACLGLLMHDRSAFHEYCRESKLLLENHRMSLDKEALPIRTQMYDASTGVDEALLSSCVEFCQGYEVRPGDPRYTRLGGTVFKKDRNSLEKAIHEGAELICCFDTDNKLKGFLTVYPPDTHYQITAHIGKQEHWYGASSYVSFVAVSQGTAAAYNAVMARMMMQAYTSNIYAGKVATANIPSLLTNGYASGGLINVAHTSKSSTNVSYQGYNDLVDLYCGDNFIRFGQGESIAQEASEEAEVSMVGLIRALDDSWRSTFRETAPDRREAMMEVRYLQTGALPGICEPTLDNLLRLWRFSQQEELRRTPGFGAMLSDASVKAILETEDPNRRASMIARMRAEARLLLHEHYVEELNAMSVWEHLQTGELPHEQRLRTAAIVQQDKSRRFDRVFPQVLDVFSWQDEVLGYLGGLSDDTTRTEMDLHFGDWGMLMDLKLQLADAVSPDTIRELMKQAVLKLPIR